MNHGESIDTYSLVGSAHCVSFVRIGIERFSNRESNAFVRIVQVTSEYRLDFQLAVPVLVQHPQLEERREPRLVLVVTCEFDQCFEYFMTPTESILC